MKQLFNPDSRLIRLCIRAYRIIHGFNSKSCPYCNMINVVERRNVLAQRLFMNILNDYSPIAPYGPFGFIS